MLGSYPNSSSDNEYVCKARFRPIKPYVIAATTAALRDATQRRVRAGGMSARLITDPSGNVTDRGQSIFFRYIHHPFRCPPANWSRKSFKDW
jgi:hypothetical protein